MQGIDNLIKLLQRRGVAIYLISGGFREIIVPIANLLGIPKENVFANRMNWCVFMRICVLMRDHRAYRQPTGHLK